MPVVLVQVHAVVVWKSGMRHSTSFRTYIYNTYTTTCIHRSKLFFCRACRLLACWSAGNAFKSIVTVLLAFKEIRRTPLVRIPVQMIMRYKGGVAQPRVHSRLNIYSSSACARRCKGAILSKPESRCEVGITRDTMCSSQQRT